MHSAVPWQLRCYELLTILVLIKFLQLFVDLVLSMLRCVIPMIKRFFAIYEAFKKSLTLSSLDSFVVRSKINFISNIEEALALLIIICFSYIVRERIVQGDASTHQYKLGLRSQTETSKRRILEFISEVFHPYLIYESFL